MSEEKKRPTDEEYNKIAKRGQEGERKALKKKAAEGSKNPFVRLFNRLKSGNKWEKKFAELNPDAAAEELRKRKDRDELFEKLIELGRVVNAGEVADKEFQRLIDGASERTGAEVDLDGVASVQAEAEQEGEESVEMLAADINAACDDRLEVEDVSLDGADGTVGAFTESGTQVDIEIEGSEDPTLVDIEVDDSENPTLVDGIEIEDEDLPMAEEVFEKEEVDFVEPRARHIDKRRGADSGTYDVDFDGFVGDTFEYDPTKSVKIEGMSKPLWRENVQAINTDEEWEMYKGLLQESIDFYKDKDGVDVLSDVYRKKVLSRTRDQLLRKVKKGKYAPKIKNGDIVDPPSFEVRPSMPAEKQAHELAEVDSEFMDVYQETAMQWLLDNEKEWLNEAFSEDMTDDGYLKHKDGSPTKIRPSDAVRRDHEGVAQKALDAYQHIMEAGAAEDDGSGAENHLIGEAQDEEDVVGTPDRFEGRSDEGGGDSEEAVEKVVNAPDVVDERASLEALGLDENQIDMYNKAREVMRNQLAAAGIELDYEDVSPKARTVASGQRRLAALRARKARQAAKSKEGVVIDARDRFKKTTPEVSVVEGDHSEVKAVIRGYDMIRPKMEASMNDIQNWINSLTAEYGEEEGLVKHLNVLRRYVGQLRIKLAKFADNMRKVRDDDPYAEKKRDLHMKKFQLQLNGQVMRMKNGLMSFSSALYNYRDGKLSEMGAYDGTADTKRIDRLKQVVARADSGMIEELYGLFDEDVSDAILDPDAYAGTKGESSDADATVEVPVGDEVTVESSVADDVEVVEENTEAAAAALSEQLITENPSVVDGADEEPATEVGVAASLEDEEIPEESGEFKLDELGMVMDVPPAPVEGAEVFEEEVEK